jgi:hypothetical protein
MIPSFTKYDLSSIKFISVVLVICSSISSYSQSNTPCVSGSPAAPILAVNSTCTNTAGTTAGLVYNNNLANAGTPSCGAPGAPDGWFRFVAPANGTVTITTSAGTMTDGVMSLYSGTCGAFTELACNDNGAGMPVISSSTLTPGATYYIRIWNWFSGTGSFSICITSPAGGTDPCSSITNIAACGSSVTANLSGSGGGWASSFCGWTMNGDEQIFSFTPATTGSYSLDITTNNGGYIDYFWINSTSGCSSGAGWNCIGDILSPGTYGNMAWTAGQTYYILLDAETTSAYTSTFSLTCPNAGPCTSITNIIGCGASYSATLSGTGSWDLGSCFWSTPGVEVIYSYTATSTGNYSFNITSISGYVDISYVNASGGCSSGAAWTCIEDVGFTGSTFTFALTSGETYYFLFDPESTAATSITFNLDCPGSAVTASDCTSAVNICSNATFQIDPNGYGAIAEIPPLGSIGNPDNINPGGSGNYGCLRNFTPETNSTWMVINIATSGDLEFSFGAGGAQAGYYDWIMYPYNPATTCSDIPTGNYAPVRCNWNWANTGGTGCASPIPAGGDPGNYEPPLAVLAGEQYIVCFSNWSSANSTVPLDFFGTATVSCTPLPSELMNLYGHLSNNESETNSSHFIIEHSINGSDFTAIGNKVAAGNSNQEIKYDFTHKNPVLGINYYRLISVDINQDSQTSRIISVNYEPGFLNIEQIYPNPTNELFSIILNSSEDNSVDIEITDIAGKRIYFKSAVIESGKNTIEIPSDQLAEGMYNLLVTDKKNSVAKIARLFKQN